jgi:hypothetical protein
MVGCLYFSVFIAEKQKIYVVFNIIISCSSSNGGSEDIHSLSRGGF